MLVSVQTPVLCTTFLLRIDKVRDGVIAGKRTSLTEVKQIGHEKGSILLQLCHLRKNTLTLHIGKTVYQSKQNFSLSIRVKLLIKVNMANYVGLFLALGVT